MDLDVRLRKLTSGISTSQAISAHAKQLSAPSVPLNTTEQVLAAEFRATIELMFLMAAVDGEISDLELQQLAASISALTDLYAPGLITAENALEDVLTKLHQRLEQDGWAARMQDASARVQSPEGRSFAFRLAAGVAFVDDHVAHAEAAAIESIASALALDSDTSQALLREVVETLFGA